VVAGQGQAMLLIDPGDGSTTPFRTDIFASSRTPTVLRSLPNPTSPQDLQFGSVFGGVGDINGDTLGDIVVGSGVGLYVVYGR
jgi:hypothetical protein